MDALSTVMSELRLQTLHMGITYREAPWGGRFPRSNLRIFCFREAPTIITLEPEGTTFTAAAGDVLLVHNTEMTMRDALDTPVPSGPPPVPTRELAPVSPKASGWLGIDYRFTSPQASLLMDVLPRVIFLPRDTPKLASWLGPTIQLLEDEYLHETPGRAMTLARLVEVAFIRVMRLWIGESQESAFGWLAALKDDRIAAALTAVHADPEGQWTVDSLARTAGMSRTAFAMHFKRAVGVAPKEYVRDWRLRRAATVLQSGSGGSIKSIIAAAGFRNESTFRTQFRRRFGRSPKEHRKHA